jgi:hypothetical protein
MMCGTALLIYLLENNRDTLPEPIYILILAIVKFNILKIKSKTLRVLNSQLQGLLLWICPALTYKFIEKEKIADLFMKELTVYEPKYEEEHERQRVILGLSTLMKHTEKPQFVLAAFPELFKTLIKLIKKNAEERIDEIDVQEGKKDDEDDDEDEEEEDENFDLGDESEDDAEFWEEQYDDNYESPLMSVDEIQYFESSVQQVQS